MGALKLSHDGPVDPYGQLKVVHRNSIAHSLKQFIGKTVRITIQLATKTRTSPQNAYYWAVVVPILLRGFKEAGYSRMNKDKIHNWIKKTYLSETEYSDVEGMPAIETIGSTTKLSTIRFFEIIEDLQRVTAEFLGINIPDPDKNWRNRDSEFYTDNIKL